MRSPLTMLRLTYPRVPSPKTVTSFQRVRSTHSPLLSRRLKLEATLTRSVEPTCLISPTRPMIVNSAIVFMAIRFFSVSPRAFGSCRRSLGCGSNEAGRTAPASARNERTGAASGGRRRAAILPREEFGHQAEGENRRAQPLRRGSAGLEPPREPRNQTDMSAERRASLSLAFCASFSLCHLHFLNILCCADSGPLLIVRGLFGWRR